MTNRGHCRSGRHSLPRAPFCTALWADRGWRFECSPRVRARLHAEAGTCRLLGPIMWLWRQTMALFAHGSPLSHDYMYARSSLFLSLFSCPAASPSVMPGFSLPLIHHLQALPTGSLGLYMQGLYRTDNVPRCVGHERGGEVGGGGRSGSGLNCFRPS